MKGLLWAIFIFFAISVGIYPLLYFVVDMSQGLLATKSQDLLQDATWNAAFYSHIIFGGTSLLTGWSQFNKTLRTGKLRVHRTLGKIYLFCVLLSGFGGLYISFFATGGPIASFGFAGLALAWLFTSSAAYRNIRAKRIDNHERWMIRSYALAFAAVTLRIWLPLFTGALGMAFMIAYPIISWLCWVPNLAVAEFIIRSKSARRVAA